MSELREFMFERVYLGELARSEHRKIHNVIATLFEHHSEHPRTPANGALQEDSRAALVCDWISGMTDRFAIRSFEQLAVPRALAL